MPCSKESTGPSFLPRATIDRPVARCDDYYVRPGGTLKVPARGIFKTTPIQTWPGAGLQD